jgi:hypothetical protein
LRSFGLFLLIVLSVAIASCGGSDSPEQSATKSGPGPTGPTGAPGASKGDRGSTGTAATPKGAVTERTGTKISFLETSFFGTKSQVTYFVVGSGGGTPLAQAKGCVAENLRKAPSAYCFAFISERAFRYSKISRRPPSKMRRPCWAAYWGKPKGRRAIGSDNNGAAGGLRCPDATTR